MKDKGDNCWSINREELMAVLRAGGVLWWWKGGPMVSDCRAQTHPRPELHPRRDTVRRLIDEGVLVESPHANKVQRECGATTFVLRQ